MSDDLPFYAPNKPPRPPRVAQPGELLFEFHVERTHGFYRCELRNHDAYGIEAQILQDNDLLISMRHSTRALAELWAREMRQAIERGDAEP